MSGFWHGLWLYALLLAGIIAVPGSDMVFTLASTLSGGVRSGVAAVAGLVVGGLVNTALVTLGLGALIAASPTLFQTLLIAGALYVAWIGWQIFSGAHALSAVEGRPALPDGVTFRRGVTTCMLNPKAHLFLLAVFPQFVKPEFGPLLPQAAIAAALCAVIQIAIYGAVVLAGDRFRVLLARSEAQQVLLARAVGLLLIGLALWALASALR